MAHGRWKKEDFHSIAAPGTLESCRPWTSGTPRGKVGKESALHGRYELRLTPEDDAASKSRSHRPRTAGAPEGLETCRRAFRSARSVKSGTSEAGLSHGPGSTTEPKMNSSVQLTEASEDARTYQQTQDQTAMNMTLYEVSQELARVNLNLDSMRVLLPKALAAAPTKVESGTGASLAHHHEGQEPDEDEPMALITKDQLHRYAIFGKLADQLQDLHQIAEEVAQGFDSSGMDDFETEEASDTEEYDRTEAVTDAWVRWVSGKEEPAEGPKRHRLGLGPVILRILQILRSFTVDEVQADLAAALRVIQDSDDAVEHLHDTVVFQTHEMVTVLYECKNHADLVLGERLIQNVGSVFRFLQQIKKQVEKMHQETLPGSVNEFRYRTKHMMQLEKSVAALQLERDKCRKHLQVLHHLQAAPTADDQDAPLSKLLTKRARGHGRSASKQKAVEGPGSTFGPVVQEVPKPQAPKVERAQQWTKALGQFEGPILRGLSEGKVLFDRVLRQRQEWRRLERKIKAQLAWRRGYGSQPVGTASSDTLEVVLEAIADGDKGSGHGSSLIRWKHLLAASGEARRTSDEPAVKMLQQMAETCNQLNEGTVQVSLGDITLADNPKLQRRLTQRALDVASMEMRGASGPEGADASAGAALKEERRDAKTGRAVFEPRGDKGSRRKSLASKALAAARLRGRGEQQPQARNSEAMSPPSPSAPLTSEQEQEPEGGTDSLMELMFTITSLERALEQRSYALMRLRLRACRITHAVTTRFGARTWDLDEDRLRVSFNTNTRECLLPVLQKLVTRLQGHGTLILGREREAALQDMSLRLHALAKQVQEERRLRLQNSATEVLDAWDSAASSKIDDIAKQLVEIAQRLMSRRMKDAKAARKIGSHALMGLVEGMGSFGDEEDESPQTFTQRVTFSSSQESLGVDWTKVASKLGPKAQELAATESTLQVQAQLKAQMLAEAEEETEELAMGVAEVRQTVADYPAYAQARRAHREAAAILQGLHAGSSQLAALASGWPAVEGGPEALAASLLPMQDEPFEEDDPGSPARTFESRRPVRQGAGHGPKSAAPRNSIVTAVQAPIFILKAKATCKQVAVVLKRKIEHARQVLRKLVEGCKLSGGAQILLALNAKQREAMLAQQMKSWQQYLVNTQRVVVYWDGRFQRWYDEVSGSWSGEVADLLSCEQRLGSREMRALWEEEMLKAMVRALVVRRSKDRSPLGGDSQGPRSLCELTSNASGSDSQQRSMTLRKVKVAGAMTVTPARLSPLRPQGQGDPSEAPLALRGAESPDQDAQLSPRGRLIKGRTVSRLPRRSDSQEEQTEGQSTVAKAQSELDSTWSLLRATFRKAVRVEVKNDKEVTDAERKQSLLGLFVEAVEDLMIDRRVENYHLRKSSSATPGAAQEVLKQLQRRPTFKRCASKAASEKLRDHPAENPVQLVVGQTDTLREQSKHHSLDPVELQARLHLPSIGDTARAAARAARAAGKPAGATFRAPPLFAVFGRGKRALLQASWKVGLDVRGTLALRELRRNCVQAFGSLEKAYDWATPGGVGANAGPMSYSSFARLALRSGIRAEDLEPAWSHLLRQVEAADLDLSTALTREEFVSVVAAAVPMWSLTQLRRQLRQRYGSAAAAFAFLAPEGLEASKDSFTRMLYGLGATPAEASELFHAISANNESSPRRDKVSRYAFLASLRHAKGLEVAGRVRRLFSPFERSLMEDHTLLDLQIGEPVETQRSWPAEAYNRLLSSLSPKYQQGKLSREDFHTAVQPLGLDAAASTLLFHLADRRREYAVSLQEMAIVIFGGLGYGARVLAAAVGYDLDSYVNKGEGFNALSARWRHQHFARLAQGYGYGSVAEARRQKEKGSTTPDRSREASWPPLPLSDESEELYSTEWSPERSVHRPDSMGSSSAAKADQGRISRSPISSNAHFFASLRSKKDSDVALEGGASLHLNRRTTVTPATLSLGAPAQAPRPHCSDSLQGWSTEQTGGLPEGVNFAVPTLEDLRNIQAKLDTEVRLRRQRAKLFAGSRAELQLAVAKLEEFCHHIIADFKTPQRALQKLSSVASAESGSALHGMTVAKSVLLAEVCKLHPLSPLDLGRVSALLDAVIEGPVDFANLLHLLSFTSPTPSILALRTRLVQLFGSVRKGLSELGLHEQGAPWDVGEFEGTLATAGVKAADAGRLFRIIDAMQRSGPKQCIDADAIRFALDNAHIVSWLEVYHQRLSTEHRDVGNALALLRASPEALQSPDSLALTLKPLQFPPQVAPDVFLFLLRRSSNEQVTIMDLIKVLQVFDKSPAKKGSLSAGRASLTSMPQVGPQSSLKVAPSTAASADGSSLISEEDRREALRLAKLFRSFAKASFSSPREVFLAMSPKEEPVSLEFWLKALSSIKLDIGVLRWELVFGLAVGWQHERWDPTYAGHDVKVGPSELAKLLESAAACLTLPALKARILERCRSMQGGWGLIAGGGRAQAEDVSLGPWMKALLHLAIGHSDACHLWSLLQAMPHASETNSGVISKSLFFSAMDHAEGMQRLIEILHGLSSGQKGPVSKSMEDLCFGKCHTAEEFEVEMARLLKLPPAMSKAVFRLLDTHQAGLVTMDSFLHTLSHVEAKLLPLPPPVQRDTDDSTQEALLQSRTFSSSMLHMFAGVSEIESPVQHFGSPLSARKSSRVERFKTIAAAAARRESSGDPLRRAATSPLTPARSNTPVGMMDECHGSLTPSKMFGRAGSATGLGAISTALPEDSDSEVSNARPDSPPRPWTSMAIHSEQPQAPFARSPSIPPLLRGRKAAQPTLRPPEAQSMLPHLDLAGPVRRPPARRDKPPALPQRVRAGRFEVLLKQRSQASAASPAPGLPLLFEVSSGPR